jgi:outer membrane receptor protein involved in Fe transport
LWAATVATYKKLRSRDYAGLTILGILETLHQFRSFRPLAAKAVTTATADDPVDVGVSVSGVTSTQIFQAVSVTTQNQIDEGTTLCQ